MTNQFQILKFKLQNVKNYWALIAIVGIAFFFRLFQISSVPPSPSLDEVSIGYNAYSIMQTGEDEYGYKYPLLLRAYDDWRPAFYVYLVIPFIKILGLTVVAVRLPSVLLSICSILLFYQIIKIFTQKIPKSTAYCFLSTLLFSISPWHIYISRLGHEANLGHMMILFGIWMFLLFTIEKKKWGLIMSAMVFALSLNSYQNQKIIAPLTVVLLGILYRKELISHLKITIVACLVGLVIALPIVRLSLTPEARVRFEKTNVLKYHQDVIDAWTTYTVARERGDTIGKIIHNPKLVGIGVVVKQYALHFNPYWLFYFDSKPEAHKIPGLGLLYIWELPFILYGTVILFKNKKWHPINWFALGMIIISPIPGAITTQAPHAMRSFTMVPWIQLIGGVGMIEFVNLIKQHAYKSYIKHNMQMILILFVGLIIGSSIYLYRQYFYTFPDIHSSSFQYALNTLFSDSNIDFSKYNQIYISNEGNLYQSYMFYLFHTQHDPRKYQKNGGTISGGYAETHHINNISFESLRAKGMVSGANNLYIGDPREFPSDSKLLKTYYSLDGIPAIVLIEL